MNRSTTFVMVALAGLAGCASDEVMGDGRDDSFTTDGKLDGFQCTPQEAAAILQVANTASLNVLRNDVGLTAKAADNILAVRKGDDEAANTADDVEFGSLAQLDAVPYIGPTAFAALLQYVHDADLVDDTAPTLGQWTSETIANGTGADFAITPDNELVLTYWTNQQHKLQLADGTVVTLPNDVRNPKPVVDANGVPHVFAQVYTAGQNYTHRHSSYRNGALVDHGILAEEKLYVGQSPDGTIFALGREDSPGYYESLTLYDVQADGTRTAEPLWEIASDSSVGFTVGTDGFPSIAHARDYGIGHHARRSANGWTRVDATPSRANRQIVTSGGPTATVLVTGAADVFVHRQNGMAFEMTEAVRHGTEYNSVDIATDKNGTVHACYIRADNVIHMQVETTGNVTTQSLGNGGNCSIAADTDGAIHMVTNLGNIVNHWRLQ